MCGCTAKRDREEPSGSARAIIIGAHSRIHGQLLVLAYGGAIRIGEYCFLSEDSRILSSASVPIGNRILISHGADIHDNNSHSLYAQRRHEHFKTILSSGHPTTLEDVPSAPIFIEDDVWIGFMCTILKGVRVGKGAVIGAGTVVTRDVEPYTIIAGNPPRVIGQALP